MPNVLELKSIPKKVIAESINERKILGSLPRHFIESTLLKIGGEITGIFIDNRLVGCGFSFPTLTSDRSVKYIVRGHRLEQSAFDLPDHWLDVEKLGEEDFTGRIISQNDILTIANPSRRQAEEAVTLQQKIWGKEAALYPFDLYRDKSGADTRLVALDNNGKTIGFLLGFIGVGDIWMGNKEGIKEKNGIWVESQIAAVEPDYQRKNIARALKLQQYQDAEERGIKLIHWTVDPLQAANAGLNYGLGAVAAEFTPNHYSFRNEKNKVAASRFGIYWLVGSDRANIARAGRLVQKNFKEFQGNPSTLIINPLLNTPNLDNLSAENILIEIPENWDEVQKNQIDIAIQWRNATDAIFEKIIGVGKGKYIITGRVFDDKTPYLIAQRFEDVYK